MLDAFHPSAGIVVDESANQSILDHLRHHRVIGAVQPVVPKERNDHGLLKGPASDLCLAHGSSGNRVPELGIVLALRPVLTGIVSIHAVFLVASLLLGAAMGWILTQLEKLFNSNTNRLNMTIAFVFLTVSLSQIKFDIGNVHVGFSSLLVCMMLGTVFCNTCPLSHDLMEKSDKWSSPLCALFFVISGAELELGVFTNYAVVVIGIVYIVFRCVGKYLGTFVSAKATQCEPNICNYLGITLFPQAGVALGMCAIASAQFGEQGVLIRNITLFAVLIYELFGPLLTRWALTKAGDIKPMSQEVKDRRKHKLNKVKEEGQPS